MYRKWSNQEKDRLWSMRKEGMSESQCSIVLDRTLYSVRSKLAVMAPIPQPVKAEAPCPQCGTLVPLRDSPGKKQIYCSDTCAHRSFRARQKLVRADLRRQADRVAGVTR